MKKLWDSPVMQLLQQSADLVLLNLVWLVCSLPVITIGPAAVAMFTVAKSVLAGGGVRVIPMFWEAFTRRFLRHMLAGLAALACAGVLVMDFISLAHQNTWLRPVLFGLLLFLSILVLLTSACLFPLLAEYDIGIKCGIYRAFLLSFRHLCRAGAAAAPLLLPILLFLFAPTHFLLLVPLWIGCYFSAAAALSVRLIQPVLAEGAGENAGSAAQ